MCEVWAESCTDFFRCSNLFNTLYQWPETKVLRIAVFPQFPMVEMFGEIANEQGRLLQQNDLFIILVIWVQANHWIYCGQLKSRTPRTNGIWQGYTFGCSHHIQTTRNYGVGFYFPDIYKEWDEEKHGKQWSYAHWLPEANPGDVVTVCILFYSQNLLATSPIPILYDRALQVIFYHSQTSIVASMFWPPEVLRLLCSFSP